MNNNTIQNNGNQYFQENNFYDSNYVYYKTEDCIASVQKVGKLSWAVIAAILGMIADIITIAIGLHELKADGLWNMISTYKLHIYTAIVGVIFIVVAWLLRTIFELLRDRSSAKYVLKRNEIYKVIPKKCSICGDTCNGKLKVVLSEKGTYCVCHRDKIPQLTVPMIKPKLIPLPPYKEQLRIVDRIEEILSLI